MISVCFRSEVCGEEESSSPPGDGQRGLPADHDGQQQRRSVQTPQSFHPVHSLCVHSGVFAVRFPRSPAGHHRELHEADADDRAGAAGVQISSPAAASL